MKIRALSDALAVTRQSFPVDTREGQVCAYVFDRLETLKAHFDSLTLGAVSTALKWSGDAEGRKAIVKALDSLTYGRVQIFERRYELWSDDSSAILDHPICELSDEDIRDALSNNYLIVNGEKVHSFLDRITVVYVVTDIAHQLADAKDATE